LIRQIHIGYGCLNLCEHCFASPPPVLAQMRFGSFRRLAGEVGEVARSSPEPYPFLFLGSASDPSMIAGFARYWEVWCAAMPASQDVRLYSHGWHLHHPSQREELDALLEVMARDSRSNLVVALSVDRFSVLARENWGRYVRNLAENFRDFGQALPPGRCLLHVTYPLSMARLPPEFAISFWRNKISRGRKVPSYPELGRRLPDPRTEEEKACLDLTLAVFAIGARAGLSSRETLKRVMDNFVPFPAGRATRLYAREDASLGSFARTRYRREALKRLADTEGILVMPDGRARLVDYDGYRPRGWLGGGRRVIPYVYSFTRQDGPWDPSLNDTSTT